MPFTFLIFVMEGSGGFNETFRKWAIFQHACSFNECIIPEKYEKVKHVNNHILQCQKGQNVHRHYQIVLLFIFIKFFMASDRVYLLYSMKAIVISRVCPISVLKPRLCTPLS